MSKKEYILTILNALLGSWPIAKDLKLLVERGRLNEGAIDILVKVFQDAIESMSKKIQSTKLTEGLENVQKIQAKEEVAYEADKISVSRLDNLIRYL